MTGMPDMEGAIRALGGDPADLPFWEGCRQGRFLLHTCARCGRQYWPASRCVEHRTSDMLWADGSGEGTLHTYTVLHHAYTPAMRNQVPYVVGVVKLSEGPMFHSNIVDCAPEAVHVGMPLRARMEQHDTGLVVPMFVPAIL